MAGTSIFHGGDSGYVSVKYFPSDLVFVPTGVPSPTASPRDALRMTLELKPKVAVAIHGSSAQNREFEKSVQEKMPKVNVIIPEQYTPKKIVI
ncbi:MBL fold metallo-hydrolase [Thermoproteota archaeon]